MVLQWSNPKDRNLLLLQSLKDELADRWPDTNFQVTLTHTIHVSWEDGPSYRKVHHVVVVYFGSSPTLRPEVHRALTTKANFSVLTTAVNLPQMQYYAQELQKYQEGLTLPAGRLLRKSLVDALHDGDKKAEELWSSIRDFEMRTLGYGSSNIYAMDFTTGELKNLYNSEYIKTAETLYDDGGNYTSELDSIFWAASGGLQLVQQVFQQ